MKTRENYQVHTATINNSGDKILFQIKLPRNAKKITGILITVQTVGIDKVVRATTEAATAIKTHLIPLEHVI